MLSIITIAAIAFIALGWVIWSSISQQRGPVSDVIRVFGLRRVAVELAAFLTALIVVPVGIVLGIAIAQEVSRG